MKGGREGGREERERKGGEGGRERGGREGGKEEQRKGRNENMEMSCTCTQ